MKPTIQTSPWWLVAACAAGGNALAATEHSSSKQTLHFAGVRPHTLEVRAITGTITVEASDSSDVEMIINKTVSADTASVFKTINGEVVVTLPPPLNADLRMKTFNGGLYTDFDVRAVPAKAVPAVEKHGGMSVYRTDGFTTVRAGNGGPELTLETLNGDVRVVRHAK